MDTQPPAPAAPKSVLVLGATGLVGSSCVRLLLADPAFARITTLARRPLGIDAPELESITLDFERLLTDPPPFTADTIICALGTTIKQAGSQGRFRRVDLEYPLAVARLGGERGARHFLLVSALGANARSRLFYSRVKGELEDAVLALPYPAVTIVRPSWLIGDRRDRRLGEEIAKRVAFLVPGKYRPVPAQTVAHTLIREARERDEGRRIFESGELHESP